MKNETKWLCENARDLEAYSGEIVVFSVNEGLVAKGKVLNKALQVTALNKKKETPYVFHVPSKDELLSPLPVVHRLIP